MDNTENIQLFSSDTNDVALPTMELQDNTELISDDIGDAILDETIKVLRIPEETYIPEVNYVLDLSELDFITISQRSAIKAMLSSNGDVPMYFYTSTGLTYFGSGDKYKLDMIIPCIKQDIFIEGNLHIYKDVKPGKPLQEVVGRDITKWRLNL